MVWVMVVLVSSVSLLPTLFWLQSTKGALSWTDIESFVLGDQQFAFWTSVGAEGSGIRAMVTAELISVVVVMTVVAGGDSRFVKRLLAPLCICVAQYFWPGRTALLHRHFLPSVLRHLPGSGSIIPLLLLRYESLQPETEMTAENEQESSISFVMKSSPKNKRFIINATSIPIYKLRFENNFVPEYKSHFKLLYAIILIFQMYHYWY